MQTTFLVYHGKCSLAAQTQYHFPAEASANSTYHALRSGNTRYFEEKFPSQDFVSQYDPQQREEILAGSPAHGFSIPHFRGNVQTLLAWSKAVEKCAKDGLLSAGAVARLHHFDLRRLCAGEAGLVQARDWADIALRPGLLSDVEKKQMLFHPFDDAPEPSGATLKQDGHVKSIEAWGKFLSQADLPQQMTLELLTAITTQLQADLVQVAAIKMSRNPSADMSHLLSSSAAQAWQEVIRGQHNLSADQKIELTQKLTMGAAHQRVMADTAAAADTADAGDTAATTTGTGS